jgi:hypothetical protein
MMRTEKAAEPNRVKETESIGAIAAMIRRESKAGKLISGPEILRRAADQKLFPMSAAGPGEEAESILKKVVDENEDLHELAAEDGSRSYYSSHFMTEAYAGILLQKQGDPLRLIAEIVRKNSAAYPRPVPLDLFTQPPFGLTPHEALNDLERMSVLDEYRDIETTHTSTSRVFLYSTRHLDPEHASMLAEWFDVGQANNP